MPGIGATVPWTIHVLAQGRDPMAAVCRQANLTRCVDCSDVVATGSVEGVKTPASPGAYDVIVGTGFMSLAGSCGDCVPTAVHQ